MSEEIDPEMVEIFLAKVIEIEESPVSLKGGQESARQERIQDALNKICE